MILGPANFFQLYDEQHADFTLGANADKLSPAERTLWLNIELYARVIREAGLQGRLEAAHKAALASFADTENARYQRYHGGTDKGDTCLR